MTFSIDSMRKNDFLHLAFLSCFCRRNTKQQSDSLMFFVDNCCETCEVLTFVWPVMLTFLASTFLVLYD